ncbi:MFS monosaccharide transporter (Hxt8) [Beauveria bassiana ARSEF 2860]|uniref:MFS monosaccharide transporter (Hxt8) n=1 Tax=Beauveria bassiana (strain ARSEF 2860) TaxID=655819 RepID=J4W4V2_BEAB2|nr:MFS monosaccharide transporter (Hxt8) [Beauveria bassiana ARSEF 2860]EJP65405.1 MFS monosaccharide transporter (Hxt8) [Beauveria bassiana ARSEF 2860]
MKHPSASLTGAVGLLNLPLPNLPPYQLTMAKCHKVVAVYIAGEALGALTQTIVGDRMGRIRFMQLLCVLVTIGTAIQTVAVHIAMFLVGRGLAGFAVGDSPRSGMVSTVPIYLSEMAPPQQRGLIGGISGCGIALGTMASNWVGYGCSFLPYGQTQWRVPLGLQIPWGVLMLVGLATFMPESPRQLVRRGREGEARRAFGRTRRELTLSEVEQEFEAMKMQISFEMEREVKSYKDIFRLYRRRAMVSIAVQTMTSLTGVNVVQYYQTILYRSLGMSPSTILALAGVYGTVTFLSNVLTTRYLADQWGRRNMILTGLSGVILVEIYTAVMQRRFQDSSSAIGKGFTILGIYLFAVIYYGMLNSTTWLYGAEVLPIALRNKIMGIASASHFIVNVAVTEAGPTAFAKIRENYYYVFVCCTTFFLIMAYFCFPETRQQTLEEIAAAFGDDIVAADPGKPGSLTPGIKAHLVVDNGTSTDHHEIRRLD